MPFALSSFRADSQSRPGSRLHRTASDPDSGNPACSGRADVSDRADGHGQTAAFVFAHPDKLASSIGGGERRRLRALVVAPTRELVVQIEENVRAYAKHLPLRMATVFGGVSERPQIEALRSGVDLVVATPGRLIDLMDQRQCNLSGIEFLVLDEADRMLDMGFLPPIRKIVRALPQKRQTLMFSASLSREIEKLTHEFQQSPKIVEIGRRANPADTVTQLVYEVRSHLKPALLLHLLADPQFDTVLVLPDQTRRDRIARRLEGTGSRGNDPFESLAKSAAPRSERLKSGAVELPWRPMSGRAGSTWSGIRMS